MSSTSNPPHFGKASSATTSKNSSSKSSSSRSRRAGGSPDINPCELVLRQLQVRDSWASNATDEDVLTSTHDAFVRFVLTTFKKRLLDDYPAVKSYLELFLGTHPDNFKDNPEHIQTVIKQNTHGRTYRITSVIHAASLEGDNRLRSLATYLFQRSGSKFAVYCLLNTFFTYFPAAPHSEGRVGNNVFGTKPATTFERLMFVAFLSEQSVFHSRSENAFLARKQKFAELASPEKKDIDKFTGEEHAGKKMEELSSPVYLGAFKKKDGESSQRAAKVLQIVCRGWNFLAQYLHFKDIEEMVQPYLWFGGSPLRAHVLMDRSDGYMPLESARELVVDQKPVLVTEMTFPFVTEYSAEVDNFLRELAHTFVNDIRKVVFSPSLYERDFVILDRKFAKYEGSSDLLPERFKGFVDSETEPRIKPLLSSRRQALGITGKSTQEEAPIVGPSYQHRQQLQIPPRRKKLPTVSSVVYKNRVEALNSARESLANSTAPRLESDMAKFKEFYRQSFHLYSSDFDCLPTLLLDDQIDAVAYGETQFICMDPPYNTRRLGKKENSGHDILTGEQMKDVVHHVNLILRPGGHAVIFCTVQQFVVWEKLFNEYRIDGQTGGSPFLVDKAPLFLINSPKNHKSNPRTASCSLQGMVEVALHLKKNGLSFEKEAKMVNYKAFNYINSSFDGTKNVLDNIPVIAGGEAVVEKVAVAVMDEEDPEYGALSQRSRRLRPEQKSVHLMKELISRFSQPGDIVVDLFAGTFSAAVACFLLPQHRVFVGCEKDDNCFKWAEKHFARQLAHYLIDVETVSDIEVPKDILHCAARISLESQGAAPLLDPNWKAPTGLPKFQRLPLHVFSTIVSLTGVHRHLVDHFKSSFDEWPQEMKHALQRLPISSLIQAECIAYSVYVTKSLIKHPSAGNGLFASQPFDAGDVICYYYGTLVYAYLNSRNSKTKRYGDTGVLGVSLERFKHYALQIKTSGQSFDAVTDYRHGDRSVFVVPPPFCVGSYINDYRYGSNDEDMPADGNIQTLPNPRSPNVAIHQVPRPVASLERIKEASFLQITALRQINRGEELYADYDRDDFALS